MAEGLVEYFAAVQGSLGEAATDGDAARQGVAQMRECDIEKERKEGLIE